MDAIVHLNAAIQATLGSDALDHIVQKQLSELFQGCLEILAQRGCLSDDAGNEQHLQTCRQALLGIDALGRAGVIPLRLRVQILIDPSREPKDDYFP